MKKVFFVLTVLFAVSQAITAQSIDSFIADFAKSEGVETTRVDSKMLAEAKQNEEDDSEADKMDKLKFIDVFSAENPSEELREKFMNFIGNFSEDTDYDTLIKVADGDTKALIVLRKGETDEKTLIIFAVEDEKIAVVKMSGEIDLDDLNF